MSASIPARRTFRRCLAAATAAVSLTVLTAACGETGSTAGGKDKTFTIGLANADTTIPFLASMNSAFEAEAKRLGMKTVTLNGGLDNAKQAANVQTLVARKVDLILVCSSSPTAVIPAIKQANRAGIPVMALNAQLNPGADLVTYIGASDRQFGRGEGKLIVQALPKGGKIAITLGTLGSTPQVERLKGIKDVLKNHPNIKIVATPVDNFKNSENLSVTQDLLSKYPKGKLDAIVAQGPQMYVGAQYARKIGRNEIRFIAGDYSKQVEAAIKSGDLYGTVNQSPVLEGKLGAQYANYWLTGQKDKVKRPNYYIPLPLITKDNVDTNPAEWSG
ncbi:sugar ABC transporter substrate-binding protein [Streptomyces luteolifulvus]|uniref:Sugar ABC transporter substrate-binding protein n=1 Tax=Streptomyces luteolifulvus TaxID=2615112 RepID=A0A6H9UWG8_9ACTN|nr:sugar ABC transporter substrate-binding protein [Streptomyces luteolifulvus]KAB1143474.1 sugar ABC transporter substrate-binding protein [Streptomyces luteolifulvus]